jgi:hypothetical protein
MELWQGTDADRVYMKKILLILKNPVNPVELSSDERDNRVRRTFVLLRV